MEPPGSGLEDAEFGQSAYLDVLGLEPVDELAEEIPELAEREEQAVAEQRGQRRRVRQPHHLAPFLIPPDSPPLVPSTPPRALRGNSRTKSGELAARNSNLGRL